MGRGILQHLNLIFKKTIGRKGKPSPSGGKINALVWFGFPVL